MAPETESRRATLINIAYLVVLATAFFLFMKYAFWLFFPFVFALAVAVILQKPINKINEKTKIKKGIISTVFLILFLLIALGLLALIGYKIYTSAVDVKDFAAKKLSNLPVLVRDIENVALRVVSAVPGEPGAAARTATADFFDRLYKSAEDGAGITSLLKLSGLSFSTISDTISGKSFNVSSIAQPVISTAMSLPSKLLAAIITIVACFFVTVGYDNLTEAAKKALKKTTVKKISTVKRITLYSLGQLVKSYAVIIFITFAELTIGLFILKLCGAYEGEHLILVAVLTALLDILPIFGTGTVIIPWALYSFIISHEIGMGIGLLIIYACITIIRQIIEPKLVGFNLGIPSILTLMGMYIGLETIGVIGMFAFPITMVVLKKLNEDGVIHLYGEKHELATKIPPEQELLKPVISGISDAVRHPKKIVENFSLTEQETSPESPADPQEKAAEKAEENRQADKPGTGN